MPAFIPCTTHDFMCVLCVPYSNLLSPMHAFPVHREYLTGRVAYRYIHTIPSCEIRCTSAVRISNAGCLPAEYICKRLPVEYATVGSPGFCVSPCAYEMFVHSANVQYIHCVCMATLYICCVSHREGLPMVRPDRLRGGHRALATPPCACRGPGFVHRRCVRTLLPPSL